MLETLIFFLIFIFGLIVGSFLNCLIYRLEIGESFLSGRSYCPNCKHILSFKDLIPVFSFLILRGKCRYCGKKISWQYPLVELATGILFVLVMNYTFPNPLVTGYWLLVTSLLIIIFVSDLKYYVIPDKVIYPTIVLTFIFHLFEIFEFGTFEPILNSFLSAILASLFFLTIVLISRGKWLGIGDVKLVFFMGLILGYPNILLALFLAFFIGAVVGVILIILGKNTLKSEIPFGPFLVTGTFLAMFFGERIVNFYLNLFLI